MFSTANSEANSSVMVYVEDLVYMYIYIQFKVTYMYMYMYTSRPRRWQEGVWPLRAAWMVWICMETADSTASSSLLNSSKQPQAPHLMIPMKIRPILFTSIPYTHTHTLGCCL